LKAVATIHFHCMEKTRAAWTF